MRIFKCTTTDAKMGRVIGWAGTEKQAKVIKHSWKNMGIDVSSFSADLKVVPNTKMGMLNFLLAQTPGTDNG